MINEESLADIMKINNLVIKSDLYWPTNVVFVDRQISFDLFDILDVPTDKMGRQINCHLPDRGQVLLIGSFPKD